MNINPDSIISETNCRTSDAPTWRFCAVGNVKAQHSDETGQVFYGTKAFTGGTKVYIDDKTWDENGDAIVIGLNHFGRYVTESIPAHLVENIRLQRIFKPKVLDIINALECFEGWEWRGRTAADRKAVLAFVKMQKEP